jgi:acetyl esterase/lipase
MVELKPSSSNTPQPKPEYSHLSEIDPEFAPLREELDKNFAVLWSLPLDEFKTAWLTAPLVLPGGAPEPGKDYEVADQQIPMKDGAEVELRVYRPMKWTENATLVLKAHGGGWVVGSHQVEEVENRMLAAHAGVVVASVDYRMAPEYKFPYAVNDCFDALKWVRASCSLVHYERLIPYSANLMLLHWASTPNQ